MFETFTDRARWVVVLAQQKARTLDHNYVGTQHILLGLINEGEGVAAKSLESLGISLKGVESDDKIVDVRREKESAIDDQDFEKAAHLHDKEKQLVAKRDEREKQWRLGDLDVVAEVDEDLVAEICAEFAPALGARRTRRTAPTLPDDVAAVLVDADSEIWGMV